MFEVGLKRLRRGLRTDCGQATLGRTSRIVEQGGIRPVRTVLRGDGERTMIARYINEGCLKSTMNRLRPQDKLDPFGAKKDQGYRLLWAESRRCGLLRQES